MGSLPLLLGLLLFSFIAELRAFCHQHDIKITLFGGASNVIVADQGIKGLVLHLTNQDLAITDQKIGDKTIIHAEAGIKMALLVSQIVQQGYQGLEYFLGVPGTLGGAIYNNSHYLSHLIGEHVHGVEVINRQGELRWLTQEECEFGYDSSRFQKSKELIFSVDFALLPGDKAASQTLIKEATEYRANTQPLGTPNSGCIFENAPNTEQLKKLFPQFADKSHVSGGFLIDQAGLKGTRIGDIEVSDKHAAFFINKGQGTASDVKKLITQVKRTVKEKFGVELHEEVFYLE